MTKFTETAIVREITQFQLSMAYPVIFAILCVISGLSNKYVYVPILFVMTLLVLFSVFFVRNSKALLVPMFMMYYSLGTDNINTYQPTKGELFASIDNDAWIFIISIAVTFFIALAIRFVRDGTFQYALQNRGVAFWGIAALDIAFISNGAFSPDWMSGDLFIGLLLAAFLSLFYLVFSSIISRSDVGIITYVCKLMVLTALIVTAQILFKAIHTHITEGLLYYHEAAGRWFFKRDMLCMSWGITTMAGGVLVLGIPAALYLAKDEKKPILYYLSALLFAAMPFIMNTRSSMACGVICFFIGMVIICFNGKNRKFNLIFSLSLLLLGASAIASLCFYLNSIGLLGHYLHELSMLLRLDVFTDRLDLIKAGIQHFSEAPVFGVGMYKGAPSNGVEFNNVFANMYHNIIVQIAASMGIVGISAFLFHIKDLFFIGIKKFDFGRILILLMPLSILLMSLADNFFFYPNFLIFYAAFIVLAEKELSIKFERKTNENPSVGRSTKDKY